MSDYCALIFDLKQSRMLPLRSHVQRLLIKSIREYNTEFEASIASSFLIILGDEWQGLLHGNVDYRPTVSFFRTKLELPFYVGVGIGACTVFEEELTVNQLDGPAFYKARHALNLAKQYGYTEVVIQ